MTYRTLVVGAGARGRQWIEELSRAESWDVAAVVEPDPDAVHALQPFGVRCFDNLDNALVEEGFDAAVVATPPDHHVTPTRSLLERRIPLLVEKPLALSFADARALVEEAERLAVPMLVGMNHRFLRSHRTARDVVQSGRLGRVGLVAASYYRPPHEMASSLARLPHRVMWGMAVHHLDALRYVLGQDVGGVFAQSFSLPSSEPPPGASLHALLEFEEGTRGIYSATYESSGHGYFEGGQEFYERIVGDDATLHVVHRWLFLARGKGLPRPIRRGRRGMTEERILLDRLGAAISSGSAEPSGRDHLKTMAIVEGCIRSSQEKRWIATSEVTG